MHFKARGPPPKTDHLKPEIDVSSFMSNIGSEPKSKALSTLNLASNSESQYSSNRFSTSSESTRHYSIQKSSKILGSSTSISNKKSSNTSSNNSQYSVVNNQISNQVSNYPSQSESNKNKNFSTNEKFSMSPSFVLDLFALDQGRKSPNDFFKSHISVFKQVYDFTSNNGIDIRQLKPVQLSATIISLLKLKDKLNVSNFNAEKILKG